MKFEKVLTNKYVLYIVLFLAITNVLGYLTTGNYESLALFVILGLLSSYFSKNMIINLSVAMIGTNFIFASGKIREGLKNDKEDEDKKKNEEMTNLSLSPAKVKGSKSDDDDDDAPGNRIDYASTVEQAYNNLSTMLGEGGISNLTKETQNLLGQQKALAQQLEGMAPLLKDAKNLLSNMKLPNMGELEGILSKFTPSNKKK